MEPGITIIKKYGNRRLYDTASSVYITLEELADRVRRGASVRVVDAKTSADLTQSTLAQIILESRRAAELLPVPLLVQLIRMGDDALAEFLGRYMTFALDFYLQAKEGAQAITPLNPFAQLPFTASNAFARMFSGLGGSGFGGGANPPAPPPAPPPRGEDVADLRRELDELKAALKRKR
jgi:polyhydroxyalkanoate synthesis repressor PhaR